MERHMARQLDQWLHDADRKPLVLRGARQVGKTWLVRDLARRQGRELVELNMERRPELADHFRSNDPRRAIEDLSADLRCTIRVDSSLLFIDEIQAAPHLISFLRWFREEMAELPVIAAGSLLDFELENHEFSVPVGRISYGYIEPMSFYEFLTATGNGALCRTFDLAAASRTINPRLHQRGLELFSEYCLVGGLPEVVSDWCACGDDSRRMRIQRDLTATYQDDFHKYRGRFSPVQLRQVMDSVPRQLGGRFMFSRVGAEDGQRGLGHCHDLLCKARVCHRVEHTAANGLPLGAETKAGLFKSIFVDIGLVSVQLGLSMLELRNVDQVVWANKGALAEQFVGQQLRCLAPAHEDPRLFYWQRADGRQGEIDYLIQQGSNIIPVEVKAGSSGSMKSLHAFMADKGLSRAVRLDTNPPSVQEVECRTTTGVPTSYQLVSLPLYMVESIPAALATAGRHD